MAVRDSDRPKVDSYVNGNSLDRGTPLVYIAHHANSTSLPSRGTADRDTAPHRGMNADKMVVTMTSNNRQLL